MPVNPTVYSPLYCSDSTEFTLNKQPIKNLNGKMHVYVIRILAKYRSPLRCFFDFNPEITFTRQFKPMIIQLSTYTNLTLYFTNIGLCGSH
jgi:hypothetical protein